MNTAKNDNPPQTQPAPAEADYPVLLIPECRSLQELSSFGTTLGRLLAAAPAQLTLRFIGVHRIESDQALVLHEILRHKSPATVLITEAWSSLINGSALLWLMGDRRRIRPTAWLLFQKRVATPYEEMVTRIIDESAGTDSTFELRDIDGTTVLRLANRYLPVHRHLGEPINAHLLGEYCLLEHQCSVADLDPASAPADPPCFTFSEPRVMDSQEHMGLPGLFPE